MKTTVIIIGRDSDANLSMASRGLADLYDQVEVATLGDPGRSITEAINHCQPNTGQVVVVPYALELGSDELESLEEAVDIGQKAYPDYEILLSSHIGYDPALVDLLEDRILAARNESSQHQNVPIITVTRQGQKPRGFSMKDLGSLPDSLKDIGTVVPGRRGEAVSVACLLDAVGSTGTEQKATFRSREAFSADISVEVARDKGWLVFSLDKKPLPARYGGPVRLLIPGTDDPCSNVKSIDQIIIE
ncbi:MAG: molybdopterin-dependent oxidoreductase [Candidatus Latescibacterota bacterium]|nr:molybdopterin-dependent oxidoreductase [Candidatus Latescibacterota bacterium]